MGIISCWVCLSNKINIGVVFFVFSLLKVFFYDRSFDVFGALLSRGTIFLMGMMDIFIKNLFLVTTPQLPGFSLFLGLLEDTVLHEGAREGASLLDIILRIQDHRKLKFSGQDILFWQLRGLTLLYFHIPFLFRVFIIKCSFITLWNFSKAKTISVKMISVLSVAVRFLYHDFEWFCCIMFFKKISTLDDIKIL